MIARAGLLAAGLATTLAVANPAAQSPASEPVAVLRAGTSHQALFGVAFDGVTGAAVGAQGAILESSDGGGHWTPVAKPVVPLALLAVGVKGVRRIAVGQRGVILVADAAAGWRLVPAVTDNRLLAVSLNSHGLAVAVGGFGTVLIAADDAAWRVVPIDWSAFAEAGVEPHLYAVDVDEAGAITIAGEFGLILRSTDAGGHWQLLHKGEASLFALQLRADGVGYAVGQNGTVLRTADHGRSWAPRNPSGASANLLGVRSFASGRVYVSGMRDMLASEDEGVTWRHVAGGDFGFAWYAALAAPATSEGHVIAVGHSGRVLRIGG